MADSSNPQRATTDEDLLPVVDDHDRPIGVLPRRQVHLEGHRHRAVHVGLVTSDGRIWLQRRATCKDVHPGWWDLSCTGHVDPDETYDAAATRELHEELGIDAKPAYIAKLEATEHSGWEFHALYWLRYDKPVENFNCGEIQEMRAFTPAEIRAAAAAQAPGLELTPCVMDHLPHLEQAAGLTSGYPFAPDA